MTRAAYSIEPFEARTVPRGESRPGRLTFPCRGCGSLRGARIAEILTSGRGGEGCPHEARRR